MLLLRAIGGAVFTRDASHAVLTDVADRYRDELDPHTRQFIVGLALDYPLKAAWFFAKQEGSRTTRNSFMNETLAYEIASGRLSVEDVKYLRLISYLPSGDREAVHDAVETGQQYAAAIRQFDEKLGLDVVDRLLRKSGIEPSEIPSAQ